MITLTRLDNRVIVINAELIKMIEATPDTIISLINGDTVLVRESVDEVVRRAVDYARAGPGFSGGVIIAGVEGGGWVEMFIGRRESEFDADGRG